MQPTNSDQILSQLKVPLDDPEFLPQLYALTKENSYPDALSRIILESHKELSQQLDETQIQESCSVRNALRARQLAMTLINDEGELDLLALPKAQTLLQASLYDLGPNREHDGRRHEHFLKVIRLLQTEKDLRQQLRLISRPLSHRLSEQIIRDTLQLDTTVAITDAHTKQAVLAAWLTFLRQNVGSCFATAPAILVHDEQPLQFLKDMSELLNTGRLKRTFEGVEYAVPMSFTWGAGDLRKQFLLTKEGSSGIPIWRSPGLLAAFFNAGLIADVNASEEAKKIVNELLQGTENPEIVTSAEQLIRSALLKHFQLTEEDLRTYENRPKPMLQSNMLIQVAQVTPSTNGSKSDLCARFFQTYERACNAFKAIKDNALLKTWEFTLASFAEFKADFAKWNLYASLGLGPDEPGGIGERLYQIVGQKLEQTNQKVHEFQGEYEQLFTQVKYLEARLRQASTEQEIKWLRVEYDSKVNEFHTFEDIRNETHEKAKRYANLFNALVEAYLRLFPEYFQEVYDANLQEVDVGPYDDSPAGFRLVYKHGRSNTSLWQPIRNHVEFVDALASFFALSESQLSNSEEFQGLEHDIGEIVTDIVIHVKTPAFLESAFYRMAVAHMGRPIKDPLQHLELIEKKPWAYTSGGTMDTLVSCYFKREDKPTTASRWVESEVELAVFLLDTIKQMPARELDSCLGGPQCSILMHSPTHAFVLKPCLTLFKEGVLDSTYTYIWVRDNVIKPAQKIVEDLFIDREMIEILLKQLLRPLRRTSQDLFTSIPGKMKARDFRDYVLLRTNNTGLKENQVDSTLYASLPFTHGYQVRARVLKVLEQLPNMNQKRLQRLGEIYDKTASKAAPKSVSSIQLRDMIKSLLILETNSRRFPQDLHAQIVQTMQQLGFAMPKPLLFADTNWVTDYFGFVANPSTGQFELWRLNYLGSEGSCMSHWKQWLNGSRKDIPWGIYNRPHEYRT